ncbi:MAG: RNA methyltransferase [Candidatus Shapirobacteria bacterium]
MKTIRVRNKNVLWELLNAGKSFEKIIVVDNLKKDVLTQKILSVAKKQGIAIERTPYHQMERGRAGDSREVILGRLMIEDDWSLDELLADLYNHKQSPFFLLLHRVTYPNNIGLIVRTAFAAGVNGLFYQGEKEFFLNEETFHLSMGTVARIPWVKLNIFTTLNELKKNGIKTFSLEMAGKSYFATDLTGPVAFVLGDEREGLSETVATRCDQKLAIPMQPGLDSLNVSASAAIVLFEKVRQEKISTP